MNTIQEVELEFNSDGSATVVAVDSNSNAQQSQYTPHSVVRIDIPTVVHHAAQQPAQQHAQQHPVIATSATLTAQPCTVDDEGGGTASQLLVSSGIVEDSSTTLWTRPAVLLLIDGWTRNKKAFKSNKRKKQPLWEDIANTLRCGGFNIDWKQAKTKWRSLTKAYRETASSHRRAGADTVAVCPYYDELCVVYGVSGNVTPVCTASSLVDDEDFSQPLNKEEGQSDDEFVPVKVGQKRRTPASRSRTDATEPFATMKKIHDDWKLIEEKKVLLEKEMHRDNMEMFAKFFEIIEKSGK